jgi:hypothetical protein
MRKHPLVIVCVVAVVIAALDIGVLALAHDDADEASPLRVRC